MKAIIFCCHFIVCVGLCQQKLIKTKENGEESEQIEKKKCGIRKKTRYQRILDLNLIQISNGIMFVYNNDAMPIE